MISKETTELVNLTKNGIILNPKSKKEETVLFSEVSKIHLGIYKSKTMGLLFSVGYFIFTLICLFYLPFELGGLSILIFLVNFMTLRSLHYKSYRLKIILNNEKTIEKRIPKKIKFEIVELIHEVRSQLQLNN